MDGLDLLEYYHIPRTCQKCGSVMIFQGVGEYCCEKCNFVDYDDYGKVRKYLETHKGATALEVESATGVSQRTIRRLLKESRIEVADGTRSFIHCELCGKEIRSGRYCPQCEINFHRNLEEQQRKQLHKDMKGYGNGNSAEEGQRRFSRR